MDQSTYQWIKYLEMKIRQLEEQNEILREQINDKESVNIENINYKIQELHVKELKGTLNIGWSGKVRREDVQDLLEDIEFDGDE